MPRTAARPRRTARPSSARGPTARPKPAPRRTPAQRRKALEADQAAARSALWGQPGAVTGEVAGARVFAAERPGEPPHWHLLTGGLWGRGFELGLRVARRKEDQGPPDWATALLRSLAGRAQEGWVPDPLQCLALAGGLPGAEETELSALAFAVDPALPALPGDDAPVPVLLAVPVTADEARIMREWSPVGLVELLARASPLLVTALDRPSLLASPRARQLIEQRVEREGSSLATMTARKSQVTRAGERVTWTLSADAVDPLVSLLKGRIGHRRPFSVVSGANMVHVVSADAPRVEATVKELTLGVSLVAARQLRAQLKARPGSYAVELLPNFTVAVV